MQRPPLATAQTCRGRRAVERMREPQPVAFELHEPLLERLVEPAGGLRAHGGDERASGIREGRDGGKCLTGRRRQAAQPLVEHALERLRDRERGRRVGQRAVADQRAADLEPVERIASCRRVDAEQQRARQPKAQPRRQQRVQLARSQGPDRHPHHTRLGPGVEPERERRRRTEPARQQREHPLATQPPYRERQGPGRVGVEPLQVIHRHDHASPGGEVAQRPEHRHRDRSLVRHLPVRVRHEQRDLQRAPLGRRQIRDRVLELGLEQISECGVRQRSLGLGGTRLEHAEAALARRLDRSPPQRRLADARLTLEQQRGRARVQERQAPQCGGHLALPADQALLHTVRLVRGPYTRR